MPSRTDKIKVSHAGNLPLPPDIESLSSEGSARSQAVADRLPSLTRDVVLRQIATGLDIVNDGEYVKAFAGGFSGYARHRVAGWEDREIGASTTKKRAGTGERDRRDFPGVYESGLWMSGSGGIVRPGFSTPGAPSLSATERVCTSPIQYIGQDEIQRDVTNLLKALEGTEKAGFIASLGPLTLGSGHKNEFYSTEEEYLVAVAEAAREEYKIIVDAGLIVQIDEPNFATTWMFYPDWSVDEYRKYLEFGTQIINHALEGLPQEQLRFHVCWGSGHRPHVNDIELHYLVDLIVKVNAQVYSIEAANVRHSHEWREWENKLPAGKILMPGVISHATDLVEHPELVANRLINFAQVIGRENVQAGTDCGIGSRVGHSEIAWAKLIALSEGARIASERLWAS